MSDTKLLPCPFCGGEAALKEWYQVGSLGYCTYSVGCNTTRKKCPIDVQTPRYDKPKDAIAAWNTRTADPVKVRLYKALKDWNAYEDGSLCLSHGELMVKIRAALAAYDKEAEAQQ